MGVEEATENNCWNFSALLLTESEHSHSAPTFMALITSSGFNVFLSGLIFWRLSARGQNLG